MPSIGDSSSSPIPPLTSKEDAILYYKSQYEQLEAELADFQASSRELEAELEKDVEAAEKRERQLQEKVQSLGFEVEEWKSKYKQSKAEANTAQNTLQKEITSLRDINRTMQLKLRDIEVANDDFERQARNTTSSLEDLESKYNVSIERGVLLEGEIKEGEQERETLRIETQRLRDELSDLKVEAEIMQEKLRHAEAAVERQRAQNASVSNTAVARPQSSVSQRSPETTASSPTLATPPAKSASSGISDTPTPPSPPVSERSSPVVNITPATSHLKSRMLTSNAGVTPRASHLSSRPPRHSRGPSIPLNSAPSAARRATLSRPSSRLAQQPSQGLPPSTSLTQIRGLIGKMQKLEQRVQSARSKLPPPHATPPRASPRPGSALSQSHIPSTITVRSQRKRTSGSIASAASSSIPFAEGTLEEISSSTKRVSRPSYGGLASIPSRDNAVPDLTSSRPSSRTSMSSRSSINHVTGAPVSYSNSSRPSSRQSLSRSRTPLGHYSSSTIHSDLQVRPRSSLGGSYASSHIHGSNVRRLEDFSVDEGTEDADVLTPTPSRRTTLGKEGSGIPTPGGFGKRVSGTGIGLTGRRISSGVGLGDMGPPPERRGGVKKLSGVGETY